MRGFRMVLIFLFFLVLGSFAQASTGTRKIELTETYRPAVKGGSADLFIPLPMKDVEYQTVISESHDSNASWVKEETVKFEDPQKICWIVIF